MDSYIDVLKISLILSCLKVLFAPAYHSTDFEVHRNWLAITHSLPISEWYFEATSEWTLDYPPFFAWFEKCLSYPANLIDEKMVQIDSLNYKSSATVLYQKLTVILADYVLVYAVYEYCSKCMSHSAKSKSHKILKYNTVVLLVLCNFGLMLVDHIHFQYNGFLFGILLLSINKILQLKYMWAAFWFAVLLNFKHIFLYIAPVYFIFLLRNMCFTKSYSDGSVIWTSFSFTNISKLGMVVVSVFGISLGPFIYLNQIPQVLKRLFPFKRGLCHAYWAPNFWSIYNIADKVFYVINKKVELMPVVASNGSMTSGLVQEFEHSILPSISPSITFILTVVSIMPILVHLWKSSGKNYAFLQSLTLCAFSSYMFGWHVHEKAVLLMIIPMSLLAVEKVEFAKIFLLLSTVGHFSIFPLIFTLPEMPIKYALMMIFTLLAFSFLSSIHGARNHSLHLPFLNILETMYLVGLVPLEIYGSFIHGFTSYGKSLPFMPLLLVSVYCSIGIFYSWIRMYYSFISQTKNKVH